MTELWKDWRSKTEGMIFGLRKGSLQPHYLCLEPDSLSSRRKRGGIGEVIFGKETGKRGRTSLLHRGSTERSECRRRKESGGGLGDGSLVFCACSHLAKRIP